MKAAQLPPLGWTVLPSRRVILGSGKDLANRGTSIRGIPFGGIVPVVTVSIPRFRGDEPTCRSVEILIKKSRQI
jgi:hypothetical protein